MWKIKNNDEYCVFASSRKQAKIRFKEKLGINVSLKMITKIY